MLVKVRQKQWTLNMNTYMRLEFVTVFMIEKDRVLSEVHSEAKSKFL